jgi:CBS domain-containing protein
MLKLRDFMTRDVTTLNADDTLRDAITLLTERFITGAPVLAGDEVVGVVSAMDIMDFAAGAPGAADTPDPSVDDGTGAWALDADTADATSSYFTDLWAEGAGLLEDRGAVPHDALSDLTVSEVMTRSLLSLPGDTEAHEAAAFMIEHGVHRVLVVDDGVLEGLVSTTDFLRLIAERRL